MATVSVKNHPNFAVICSFLQRYGEQLRLPDLTIPELEQVLDETHSVGHGLKELLITLMKRVVNSFSAQRWEKHLIRLIDNYHSHIEAWELESLGYSLCKLETKLSILKYLCETQFDDNPKFKNLVNKEDPLEQKLKPIGRDKLGLVYWYQKDHGSNIRIYREEQDDIEETSWQRIVRGRDDLANLITELRIAQDMKQPLDSLESSRSATPVLTNGDSTAVKAEPVEEEGAPPKQETSMVNGVGGDIHKTEIKTEDPDSTEVKTEKGLKAVTEESGKSCMGEKSKEGEERTGSLNLEETQGRGTGNAPCEVVENNHGIPNDGTKAERTDEGSAPIADGGEDQLTDTGKCIDSGIVETKDNPDEKVDSPKISTEDQKDTPEQKDGMKTGTEVKGSGAGLGEEGKQEGNSGQDGVASIGKGEVEKGGEDQESITRKDAEKGTESKADGDRSVGEGTVKSSGRSGEELVAGEDTNKKKSIGSFDGATAVAGDGVATSEKVDSSEGKAVEEEEEHEEKMNDSAEVKGRKENPGKKKTEEKTVDTKDDSDKGKSKAKESEPPKEPARARRSLRTRKPPPKKEEEPPPKPQRKPKASKQVKSAHKKKQSRTKETESDSSDTDEMMSLAKIKEQIVEEEEEESEEEGDTSDEDLTLRNEPLAAPVKKARTAKSKKSASEEENAEPVGDPCIKCGNYDHPEQILLCDSCDAGSHTACLRPPLMFVPDGEWFCPSCEHVTLLKNLEAALSVVDSELKVIQQKNRKKHNKFRWLLTDVCPANILPEDSSVLITKRVEKVEKPARPRHKRTRPKPRQVFVEEPEEIEYIQRKSARNRKKINYKFEDFDSAISSAIHDEVEEKRKARTSGENVVHGQSRGKDMSTIEAAKWEEEDMERREARKGRKKPWKDLDATTEEEEEDESDDEFKINNDDPSDEDFITDENEVTEGEEEEEEVKLFSAVSGSESTSSDPEYGVKPRKKGFPRQRKKKKVRVRKGDLGPVRRSDRNVGKETRVYDDSSSEEEKDRPRDAWRMNPIIVPSRKRMDSDDSAQSENDLGGRSKGRREDSDGDDASSAENRKRRTDHSSGEEKRRRRKRRKQKKESSSSEHDAGEKRGRRKKPKQKKETSSSEDQDEGFVQQKRKFRIDSDDSEDGENGNKSKGGMDDEDGSGEESGPRGKKQKSGRSLRGGQSRVDYRKMADGSSSGEGDSGRSKGEEKGAEEGAEEGGADSADGEAEVPERLEEDAASKGAADNDDEGDADHSGQNNTAASVEDENLSLSLPISDIEDLKDSVTPSKSEPIERVAGKKTSSEEDDLEGVTDIFDYLTKD